MRKMEGRLKSRRFDYEEGQAEQGLTALALVID
jgi:hypothetical protein